MRPGRGAAAAGRARLELDRSLASSPFSLCAALGYQVLVGVSYQRLRWTAEEQVSRPVAGTSRCSTRSVRVQIIVTHVRLADKRNPKIIRKF